jgi:hypothetical protein
VNTTVWVFTDGSWACGTDLAGHHRVDMFTGLKLGIGSYSWSLTGLPIYRKLTREDWLRAKAFPKPFLVNGSPDGIIPDIYSYEVEPFVYDASVHPREYERYRYNLVIKEYSVAQARALIQSYIDMNL